MSRNAQGFVWFIVCSASVSAWQTCRANEDHRSTSHGLVRMETSRPLALQAGNELYVNWSRASTTTPAIQHIDMSTGRVVWQHKLGNARVMSMHLLPDRLIYVQEIYEQPLARIAWLTRATGEFVQQFEIPLAPDELEPVRLVNNQILISERSLHDGMTGKLIETLPTINRLCSAIDGNCLVDLVPAEVSDHSRWSLRSFDLSDGRLVQETEWIVGAELQQDLVDMPTMVLSHSGIVVLQINNLSSQSGRSDGSRFLGLNSADATVLWTTTTPVTAPVAWADEQGNTIRLIAAERRFQVRPIQVSIATGERRPQPDWPAPADLLTWHNGQRSVAQSIRKLGSNWVGSLRSVSGSNVLILTSVDSDTGALRWTATHPEIMHPVHWIEETNDQPQWLVFAAAAQLQVVSAENGRKHLDLTPAQVGLEPTPLVLSTSFGDHLAASEEPPQSVTPLLLTGFTLLAILVAGTGFATSRVRRNRTTSDL